MMIGPLHSDNISEIVKALAKANATISHALMDSNNPHFNSDFASLESVIDTVKGPYLANDVVVLQQPSVTTDGKTVLVTTLAHVSGQWFKSYTPVLSAKSDDPQKMGSGLSYARRYALAAMATIGQTDDDGAKASGQDGEGAKKLGLGDEREKKVMELIKKFRQLKISEPMILARYKAAKVGDLTDKNLSDLNKVGAAIVNDKIPIQEFFKGGNT